MAKLRRRGRVYYSDLYLHGKRVVKALSSDKGIAEQRLADLIKRKDAIKYGHGQRDSPWLDFKQEYLTYSSGSKKPKTTHNDKAAIRALEAFRPFTRLAELTPELLERWKGHQRAQEYAPATINRDLGAIKAMLRKAAEWGYVAPMGWDRVRGFKAARGRLYFYTPADLKRLLKAAKGMHKTLILLCARAGLRRSEAYWLAWKDVDLDRGLLSVTPKGGWQPKDFEQRHIPLADDLKRHLAGLPRATEWVLGERPERVDKLSLDLYKLARSLEMPGTLHILRHTFASHLAQAGVPLYTISKLLGHASVKTSEIYSHLVPESLSGAVERLPVL